MISAVFVTLILLVDMIDQLRNFEGDELTVGQLVQLIVLNTPEAVNQILPLLMILSTVVLFVGLARSGELVVTRATGRSGIRALRAPMLMAALIGLLAVSTLNPIVAATSNRYQQLVDTYRTGQPTALSLTGEGLWLRQGGARGQSVIHATGYSGANTVTLFGVTILTYARDGGPVRRIQAQSARLDDTEWVLRNAKVWPLAAGLNPEAAAGQHSELRVPTTLTRDRIRDTIGRPSGISIYDLPQTIRDLRAAGFSTCLLYTSPSPRDLSTSRMPSSA